MRLIPGFLTIGLLAASLTAPASAAIYSTTFSGTVSSQSGTIYSVGNAVNGSFTYSSDAGRYLNFSIDGFSASGAYNSIASVTPGANPFTALFETQISATSQGGNLNQTLALDLEALTNFTASTALGVLTTPTLSGQLDPTLSNFTYFSGTASGTNIVSLTAALTQVTTQVPEPATLALLAAPLLGLVTRRRRR